MIHNIDYHFHPNLPKSRKQALKKCQKFWETFQKKNINTVIITEHNFKNPKRAYELMKETKPADCYVFPGMEHVTAEGMYSSFITAKVSTNAKLSAPLVADWKKLSKLPKNMTLPAASLTRTHSPNLQSSNASVMKNILSISIKSAPLKLPTRLLII